MATSVHQQWTQIKVPAAYLEDARTAVIRQLASDIDMLRVNHGTALERRGSDLEDGAIGDRDDAADQLHRSIGLLDQVLRATDDMTFEGRAEDISFALGRMTRVLAERLDDEKGFEPIDMAAVSDIGQRLQWIAEQHANLYSEVA